MPISFNSIAITINNLNNFNVTEEKFNNVQVYGGTQPQYIWKIVGPVSDFCSIGPAPSGACTVLGEEQIVNPGSGCTKYRCELA